MRSQLILLYPVLSLFVVLSSCAVGRHHTSDAALERQFFQNEVEFETLLAAVKADPKLQMIALNELRYGDQTASGRSLLEIERVGMNHEQWQTYQKMLRKLGLVQITKSENGVSFKVDLALISNGSSEKGYRYEENPQARKLTTLESYRITERDRDRFGNYMVTKPLKGNWYLYLFVNG